ncbi:MAG: hypothetical protein JO327_13485 [Nitrososphaeraceae archaeon]|nr:hypothetical protein [Nitrososphaeraceae archaeon]MBV9669127.1 hypothetical protein [Nitrososphaeraceae archaeon]
MSNRLCIMRVSGKRILVVVIMGILVSSVIAGAVSYFNRSSTTTAPTDQTLLNSRLNNVVDFCLKSLPTGTSACDSQLGPILDKICGGENKNIQQSLDACHNGKVIQYYKVRSNELPKRKMLVSNSSNNISEK